MLDELRNAIIADASALGVVAALMLTLAHAALDGAVATSTTEQSFEGVLYLAVWTCVYMTNASTIFTSTLEVLHTFQRQQVVCSSFLL